MRFLQSCILSILFHTARGPQPVALAVFKKVYFYFNCQNVAHPNSAIAALTAWNTSLLHILGYAARLLDPSRMHSVISFGSIGGGDFLPFGQPAFNCLFSPNDRQMAHNFSAAERRMSPYCVQRCLALSPERRRMARKIQLAAYPLVIPYGANLEGIFIGYLCTDGDVIMTKYLFQPIEKFLTLSAE